MSYYADADPTSFRDQSPQANFARRIHGTPFQGRSLGQMVKGLSWSAASIIIWLAAQIILLLNGHWMISLGFLAITLLEGKMPKQLKFLGDAAFIALFVSVWMLGMPVASLMLAATYFTSGMANKNLYGNFFHEQVAYWKGKDSGEYRREQLGLPPR